jgi:hypothetical protein
MKKRALYLISILAAGIVTANMAFAKAVDTWQLSEDGLGPIKIGMKVVQAEKASQKKLVLEPLVARVTEDCRFATLKNGPKEVFLMLNHRTIVRIDIKNPKIKTTQGFHLGSNADTVKTLNKGKIEAYPNKYEADKETLVVTPKEKSNLRLVFDTDGKKILYMRAGKTPEVEYVEGCS